MYIDRYIDRYREINICMYVECRQIDVQINSGYIDIDSQVDTESYPEF